MDRRLNPRLDFGFNIFTKQQVLGFVKNISIDGCFVETEDQHKIDDTFDVIFELPDSIKKINAKFKVLWKNEEGVGAKLMMNNNNRRTYYRFIGEFSYHKLKRTPKNNFPD